MKKALILITGLIMMSCAKEYTCQCEVLNKSQSTAKTTTYTINKKKDVAVQECNAGDESSVSFEKNCELLGQ